MQYALIQDNTVAQFPYSETQFRRDNPRTSYPRKLTLPSEGQNGTLVAVVETDRPTVTDAQVAVPDAAPSLVDGVWTLGWTVRDKRPEEYHIQTAEEARKEVVRWIDGISAQVLDLYPRAVQARWAIEEAAARAVLNGTDTDTQLELVTREGAAKGRTPGEHAQAIVRNADRFRAITDQINTLFLATDTALQQADHPAHFMAILARAKEQAAPLAEAYGLKT